MFKALALVKYLPLILGLVTVLPRLVEELRGDLRGPEKKSAVMDLMATTWELLGKQFTITLTWEQIAPVAGGLVDALVALYNRLGIFGHDGEPSPMESIPASPLTPEPDTKVTP